MRKAPSTKRLQTSSCILYLSIFFRARINRTEQTLFDRGSRFENIAMQFRLVCFAKCFQIWLLPRVGTVHGPTPRTKAGADRATVQLRDWDGKVR